MNITDNLAAVTGFVRAVAGDLPDPMDVSVNKYTITVQLDTLDDLREWAAYFGQAPTSRLSETTGRIHSDAHLNHVGTIFKAVHVESESDVALREAAAADQMPRDCEAMEWA